MVYVKNVQRALDFYRELLGFKQVNEFRHEGKPVYCEPRALAATAWLHYTVL